MQRMKFRTDCGLVVLYALLCLLCVSAARGDSGVIDYSVTAVTKAERQLLPTSHWSHYVKPTAGWHSFTCTSWSRYTTVHSLDYAHDLYSQRYTWSMLALPFLTPLADVLCNFFCSDSSPNSLNGFYQLDPTGTVIDGGGGDWPMIGVYVADMASGEGVTCVRYVDEPAGSLTVEYANLSLIGHEGDGVLEAQVTLEQGGSIVMRYQQIPGTELSQMRLPPMTGLILSKTLYKIVPTPTMANHIVAYRFDPVPDPCGNHTTTDECWSSDACGWCAATKLCMSSATSQDRCPTTQFHRKAELPSAGTQAFYAVNVTDDGRLLAEAMMQNTTRYDLYGISSVPLNISFPFTFFGHPHSPTAGTPTVRLASSGAVFVFDTEQDCGPVGTICPNGNYSFAILLYETMAFWTAHTTLVVGKLPNNTTQNPLCNRDSCAEGIVLQLQDVSRWYSTRASFASISVQLYLDSTGTIVMTYSSKHGTRTTAAHGYPAPFIGLFRHGLHDPSTVRMPFVPIHNGTQLRFTPITACGDCGMHGYCDEPSKTCVCSAGFSGALCDECAPSFYGPQCDACPPCMHDGKCKDGRQGGGTCECVAPYSGIDCSTNCDTVTPCQQCNSVGGYCECGTCKCRAGWGGADCATPLLDPCVPLSFDGCPVCTTRPGCAFCYTNVCVSPALAGTPRGQQCSSFIVNSTTVQCTYARVVSAVDFDLTILLVPLLLIVAVLLIVALVILLRNHFRWNRPTDPHIMNAAGGVVNFRPSGTERRVMQVAVIPPDSVPRDRYVVGIPLKQIPLDVLYQRQQARKAEKRE